MIIIIIYFVFIRIFIHYEDVNIFFVVVVDTMDHFVMHYLLHTLLEQLRKKTAKPQQPKHTVIPNDNTAKIAPV